MWEGPRKDMGRVDVGTLPIGTLFYVWDEPRKDMGRVDVGTLPIGTLFYVWDGAWYGKVIEYEGEKAIKICFAGDKLKPIKVKDRSESDRILEIAVYGFVEEEDDTLEIFPTEKSDRYYDKENETLTITRGSYVLMYTEEPNRGKFAKFPYPEKPPVPTNDPDDATKYMNEETAMHYLKQYKDLGLTCRKMKVVYQIEY